MDTLCLHLHIVDYDMKVSIKAYLVSNRTMSLLTSAIRSRSS